MVQATPGWGAAPQTPATTPPAAGGASLGRLLLVAGVVGLVVLAGSALGGYALSGGFDSERGQSAQCSSFQNCIPSLTVNQVRSVLQEKGFACPEPRSRRYECLLYTGANVYQMELAGSREDLDGEVPYGTADGSELIQQVRVNVQFPPGEGQPTVRTRNFVQWFATLPFTDPADAAEVSAWVEGEIGGRGATAVIGGYEYELTVAPARITLSYEGVYEK